MAKRLSKALRGKRRWIGVIVSAEIKSKQDAIKSLEMMFTDSELGGIPLLTEYNQNQLYSSSNAIRKYHIDTDD